MSLLEGGFRRVTVAQGILNSQEARGVVLNQIYQSYLGRPLDSSGWNFYQSFLASGGTFDQAKALIMGSAEYFANNNGTPFGWLFGVYRDALGRTLDDAGVAYWGGQLAAGKSRFGVALAILQTFDADTFEVQSWYLTYLRHGAGPDGLSFWAGRLQSGERDENVLGALLGSDEYYNLVNA
jgi:hypothetical protein